MNKKCSIGFNKAGKIEIAVKPGVIGKNPVELELFTDDIVIERNAAEGVTRTYNFSSKTVVSVFNDKTTSVTSFGNNELYSGLIENIVISNREAIAALKTQLPQAK